MRTKKIVIYVEGGNVQSVMADGDTPPEIVLIDADNLEENFDNDQIEQMAETAQEGCRDLPIGGPDTSLACECNGEKCGAKVHPEDPYYSSPCGTFCSDCMHDHAEECEVCANEFELEGSEA